MPGPKSKNQSQQLIDLRKVDHKPSIMRHFGVLGAVLGALITIGVAAAVIAKTHPAQSTDSKAAMTRTVADVGKLMLLPDGETPTYGTVADTSKLKSQTFFKNAHNGDEILIYQKARLTILYRKSLNKIINVGPLIVGSSGSPYVTSRFAIKNGTSNPALADALAARII